MMTSDVSDELSGLRSEIDRLDAALASLFVERQAVSARIGGLKGAERPLVRPGREAQIMRRLVADVAGKVEPQAVIRVWREIFAASTRAQGPFAIAICAPTGERAIWDLARGHFGNATPVHRVDRPPQALRCVVDDSVNLAVLPPPDDDVLWWTALIDPQPRLHVIARLPFAAMDGGGDGDGVEAFVVGRVVPDASGDDMSLLALNAAAELSRGRLRELLAEGGFDATWRGVTRPPASPEAWHLIEVPGFVEQDDPRLEDVSRSHPQHVVRCVRVGAYARPLSLTTPPPAA